jgi:serine/threonine protein phosphatase PrpC
MRQIAPKTDGDHFLIRGINVGDSRCMVFVAEDRLAYESTYSTYLSHDHKPDDEEEQYRIE